MNKNTATQIFSSNWLIILSFIAIKLTIHFLTYNNYELHRDAYLYYAYSDHPAWGYIAVPPSIGIFAKIATSIFGNTTFALRFFPAIIGALNFVVIGLMIKELKGGKTAVWLACVGYLFSPAYMHTAALFQPVVFNQFYWFLSGYLILLLINRNETKYWIGIAIVFALAFLNKYSIVFFIVGFLLAMLLSKHRRLFLSKYFVIACGIAIVLVLPNIIWQFNHNWPVIGHMEELRERQLVHVRLSNFLTDQFLMNIQAFFIWIAAILTLLFHKQERQNRVFAWMYLIIILLLILGSGKSYYTLGFYPILIVFGAHFIDKYIVKYRTTVVSFLIINAIVSFYGSLSFDGIPFYGFEKVARKDGYRWEDGKNYNVPQDMADMTGWSEIGNVVRDIYLNLDEETKKNCAIYCHHYGQAGSVMFYGKDIGIPQPISFNASFIFWSPDSLTKEYVIWVYFEFDDEVDPDSLLNSYFEQIELKHEVSNPYFRENGTRIYLCRHPNEKARSEYVEQMAELKKRYRRN